MESTVREGGGLRGSFITASMTIVPQRRYERAQTWASDFPAQTSLFAAAYRIMARGAVSRAKVAARVTLRLTTKVVPDIARFRVPAAIRPHTRPDIGTPRQHRDVGPTLR